MKFTRVLATTALTAMALVGTTACSNGNTSSSSNKIPDKVTQKTTVVFWHAMTGSSKSALEKLTHDFEKKNPKIVIKLQGQGGNYNDLQAKINSTLQSPKNLPTITQAYSDWLYNAAQNKMLVNLTPYIKNTSVGWGSVQKSQINSDLLKGAQIKNTQYGIPFNKSTEVLFYNASLLKKYKIQVPTTMAALKAAAKTIYAKSNHKVVGAGFDSLNNYYLLGMKNRGQAFSRQINFAGKTSTRLINDYAEGVHEGYFRIAGTDNYLSYPFGSQKVAMFIGTSASESYVKEGVDKKFKYGVAPRPEKVNVQQGTDLYMFKQARANQKAAAFRYIKFLVSKSSQLYWAEKTGYLPVNETTLKSTAYQNSKQSKVPSVIAASNQSLYALPVTKNSNAAYMQVSTIMQTILSQASKKDNWQTAIKAGQKKFDASWHQ